MEDSDRLARLFGLIAVRAGASIMEVRASGRTAQIKSDGSPVTQADLQADEIIRACLRRNLPHLPVITEETYSCAGRVKAGRFVLVDPLDGTKEFVQGSTEFTVNIAFVESGIPLAGAVYAPALGELYLGGACAYKLRVNNRQDAPDFSDIQMLKVRSPSHQGLRIVTSRSHLDLATQEWIDRHRVCDLKPSGSSLKFCIIAEGEADVYPRFAPTMEWDTAAGHAVLLAAGGVVNGVDGKALRYGKPGYLNPAFVAWGRSPRR